VLRLAQPVLQVVPRLFPQQPLRYITTSLYHLTLAPHPCPLALALPYPLLAPPRSSLPLLHLESRNLVPRSLKPPILAIFIYLLSPLLLSSPLFLRPFVMTGGDLCFWFCPRYVLVLTEVSVLVLVVGLSVSARLGIGIGDEGNVMPKRGS
jgi:hypothetical protein